MKKQERIDIYNSIQTALSDIDESIINQALIDHGYLEYNRLIFQFTERKRTYAFTIQIPKEMIHEDIQE